VAWSPDGTQIAFAAGHHRYVMHTDGSQQTDLTRDPLYGECCPAGQP
jgi:Tol biopolymer transport system component